MKKEKRVYITKKRKSFHDFSDEELEKMSEEQIEKLDKCGRFDCFICNGDRTY